MSSLAPKIYVKDRPIFDRLKQLKRSELYLIPLSTLPFGTRAHWAFKKLDVRTIGDLVQIREVDFLKLQNVGHTTLGQIRRVLQEFGLTLGMLIDDKTFDVPVFVAAPKEPETLASTLSTTANVDLKLRWLIADQTRLVRRLDAVTREITRIFAEVGNE